MNKNKNAVISAYNKGYRVIGGNVISPYSNNFRVLSIDTRGYYRFTVKVDKISYGVQVHRLVAYQKYRDKIFEKGIQVRHLDGNPLNNLEDNIAIGTQSDNQMDIPKKQRSINAGKRSRKHKHEEIIYFYNKTKSYKETMKKFDLSSSGTLSYILNKSLLVK